MKKTEIALAIICILITVFVFITFFVGWGVFGFGHSANKYYHSPPPANATLWEKSQIPNKYAMCSRSIEQVGYLSGYSPGNDRIKTIFFMFSSVPGIQIDLTKTNFTISTAIFSKTLHYGDQGFSLNGKRQRNITILDQNDVVELEFNLTEMGFSDESFGPDQRFIIAIVTPEDGSCNNIFFRRYTTPRHMEPMTNSTLV